MVLNYKRRRWQRQQATGSKNREGKTFFSAKLFITFNLKVIFFNLIIELALEKKTLSMPMFPHHRARLVQVKSHRSSPLFFFTLCLKHTSVRGACNVKKYTWSLSSCPSSTSGHQTKASSFSFFESLASLWKWDGSSVCLRFISPSPPTALN